MKKLPYSEKKKAKCSEQLTKKDNWSEKIENMNMSVRTIDKKNGIVLKSSEKAQNNSKK